MVQEATGRRARNRLARHAAYLHTAKRLVSAEGLEALTMQRMAAELDCAVGTIYTYFPSKSALVAEVQRDAVEKLATSYLLARAELDRSLARSDKTKAALTRVVGFGRFWIATTTAFPDESHLLQTLMAEVRPTVDPTDAMRVVPSAMKLLGFASACFEDAHLAGALSHGDGMERAVVLGAALNGVLLIEKLSVWDEDLLDGARLAHGMLLDLLGGWGADRKLLAAADRHIDAIAARGPIAPPVPDATEET